MSIVRESSCRSSASSSASSTTTNWPFATSQPLTSSSGPTSRSCFGHQRFCLIGVRHSRCSSRNETSDWRAAGFVAGASPTGMLTSPKLSDPFQVTRMTLQSRGGAPFFGIDGPSPPSKVPVDARKPHDSPPLARCRGPEHGDRLPRRADGNWREVPWAEAAERVENLANGLLARGVRKGEAFAHPRAARRSSGRCSTSRSPTSAPSARRSTRTARRATCSTSSTTPSRSACSARTTRSARRSRRRGSSLPGLRHVLTFDDLPALEEEGRRVRGGESARARRRGRRDRRGGPVHVHLHVRHDRPAEGLHDPPPQLLRDGRDRGRPSGRGRPGRRHAPLPPARPQLRSADAPLRAVRRLHDRVPARPAGRRPGDAGGAADGAAERAARVREGAHRGRRRRSTRRPARAAG